MTTISQRHNLLQACMCLCHYYVSVLKTRKQEQKEYFKYKSVLYACMRGFGNWEILVVKDDMQLEYSATPAAIAICFYVLDIFILLHLRFNMLLCISCLIVQVATQL